VIINPRESCLIGHSLRINLDHLLPETDQIGLKITENLKMDSCWRFTEPPVTGHDPFVGREIGGAMAQAWTLSVLMPISASRPYSPPSAKRVLALCVLAHRRAAAARLCLLRRVVFSSFDVRSICESSFAPAEEIIPARAA
jgi:hypothetical protein